MENKTASSERSTDSFCRALFNGHLLEDRMLPYPQHDSAQWEDIQNAILRFASERLNSKEIDEKAKIPPEVLDEVRQLGLFGMIIPEQYGGFGLGATAYAKVMEA